YRQYRYLLFFSSRRRHTRFSRDWSSDVCSSDLRQSQRVSGTQRTVNFTVRAELQASAIQLPVVYQHLTGNNIGSIQVKLNKHTSMVFRSVGSTARRKIVIGSTNVQQVIIRRKFYSVGLVYLIVYS